MNKKIFYVYMPGDESVGIYNDTAKVTFEDNLVWDDDLIKFMKKDLAEQYDTKIKCVQTEKEHYISEINNMEFKMTHPNIKKKKKKRMRKTIKKIEKIIEKAII